MQLTALHLLNFDLICFLRDFTHRYCSLTSAAHAALALVHVGVFED